MLAQGNSPVFEGFFGTLGVEGDAVATFVLPGALAGANLVGLECTFAAAIVTPPGCVTYTTHPVTVTLVP